MMHGLGIFSVWFLGRVIPRALMPVEVRNIDALDFCICICMYVCVVSRVRKIQSGSVTWCVLAVCNSGMFWFMLKLCHERIHPVYFSRPTSSGYFPATKRENNFCKFAPGFVLSYEFSRTLKKSLGLSQLNLNCVAKHLSSQVHQVT